MSNSILEIKKNDCYGCELCVSACPVKAISMNFEQGFLYPRIDKNKCISCGKCLKMCIAKKQSFLNDKLSTVYYYGYSMKKNIISRSTSGGIAYELYNMFLDEYKGVVYGVHYNEKTWFPEYTRIEDKEELNKIQGTKYAQASKKTIYKSLLEDLKSDRYVLFIGTPCEISAVKNFIGNKKYNILLVQLVCMGVTSPLLFKKYIDEKSNNDIKEIHERFKKKNWENSYFIIKKNNNDYCRPFDLTEFSFIFKWVGRSTCYNCKYKGEQRVADITIGDFWGAENYVDSKNKMGMSIISTHTSKGECIAKKMKWKKLDNYDVNKFNKYINKSREFSRERELIIKNYNNNNISCDTLVKKYAQGKTKIRYYISHIINNNVWDIFH